MTGGWLFGSVLLGLMFPGFGQGLAFRRNRMLVAAIATIATTIAILWSVWFLPITLAIRVVAAADAYLLLRRQTTPGHRVLAAIALVIGAVGGGTYELTLEAFRIPSSSMSPTLVIGDNIYVDKLSLRWHPPERGEVIVFVQPCAQIPYVKRVIALGGDTVEVRCNVVYVNGTAIPNQLVAAHTTYDDYSEPDGRWSPRTTSRYRETHGGHTYDVFRGTETSTGPQFPNRDLMIAPACRQSDYYAPKPGARPQPTGQIVVTNPNAGACEQQAHFVVPPRSLFMMGDNRNNANDSRYWGVVGVDAVIGRVIGVWMNSPPHGERDWSRVGAIE